jgi:hypothetical protein
VQTHAPQANGLLVISKPVTWPVPLQHLNLHDHAGEKVVEQIAYERGGKGGAITVGSTARQTVELGLCGRRSVWTSRSLEVPPSLPITSMSPNGFRSPRPCTIWRPCISSATSQATFREKAAWSPSQSSWLASIVIPHQPHFIGQPDNVSVLWGYGLFVDRLGDFVKKPMSGTEIRLTNGASLAAPAVVIAMGSSGSGKLTIGGLLALRLRWEFNYSDWFHPNVEKMHNGIPRTDEDRGPWLDAIAAGSTKRAVLAGHGVIARSRRSAGTAMF